MHRHRRIAIVSTAALAVAVGVFAYAQSGQDGAGENADIELSPKKISYAIGYDIGRKFEQQDVKINAKDLAAGLRDQQQGNAKRARMNEQQVDQVLQAFRQQLMQRQRQQQQAQAEQNQRAGKQFLAQNKNKQGVNVTDSGLQYKVIDPGQGQSPNANDQVTVHYTGKLLDGTVFDSSRKRGEPATFGVSQVIEGWTEALQMMKPGAKWKLWIPAELAYGQRGAGDTIKPGATLVFTVELLEVSRQNGSR
jgi:FKBP-type peptidyl-prolyl cis-trans isomerase